MHFDENQIDQNKDENSGNHQEQSFQDDNGQHENDTTIKCLAELSMWQDQCKRISAEFENFKRRVDRDKARWIEVAQENVLKDLLSFVDTFDLALQHKEKVDIRGIEMARQELLKILAKYDVVPMPVGAQFDPTFHEAIMQVSSADHKSGQVVQVLSLGFMMKDRVLRPAKVSVAV